MSRIVSKGIHHCTRYLTLSALAVSGLALAQDPANPPAAPDSPQEQTAPHGWRRVGDPPPPPAAEAPAPDAATPNDAGAPDWQNQNAGVDRAQDGASPDAGQAPPPARSNYDAYAVPPRLTIKAGTYLTVRVNQPLSSDRNQPGDAFTTTLVRPIVVDGVVVAQTGQTLGGRVAEAQKAGRVSGLSRLGLQLTDLTLVDGQQVPIQSQLITRSGNTSEGRDAAAIAGTTGMGAAVGAAADWGRGAAIGAGAGAVAGIVGVLLTRGHATVVYPEQVLTFRIEAPVTVATDRAPQAFRYVQPNDYNQAQSYSMQRPPARPAPPPPSLYYSPYYYPYGYGYPYGWWGPSVGFYWGPSFFYGRGFYGRGWRR